MLKDLNLQHNLIESIAEKGDTVLLVSTNSVFGFKNGEYLFSRGKIIIFSDDADERGESPKEKNLRCNIIYEEVGEFIKKKVGSLSAVVFCAGGTEDCYRALKLARTLKEGTAKILLTCNCECQQSGKKNIIGEFLSFEVCCGGQSEMAYIADIFKRALGGF